ncbi:DNA adenine methylase [Mesoplasma lactucae ATCC 49193]|uniref:site-specific DNA-methyltransferase (adenine-specific) n=2 Tax=Mesoplasma lactucae TaxID=138853 RepID=A0A291ISB4_9MOLU|nr:DNA adenine methylase [Mesoplasma lactucae ATCC 49193]
MNQIQKFIPDDISTWIEPFLGGGSPALNVKANFYILNDLDPNIIGLHKYLAKNANNKEKFFKSQKRTIQKYNLSSSYWNINMPSAELKLEFKKTYYSKKNWTGYKKLKDDFNNKKKTNFKDLYLLLVYGFNHMIRFNSHGDFNLPVGNVDFNNNVVVALNNYFDWIIENDISFYNLDYKEFLKVALNKAPIKEKMFVFLDPPYLVSNSEYNKLWNKKMEEELYKIIDILDEKNINFGITNLAIHKGRENEIFNKWRKKYLSYDLNSNFISYHDNSVKKSREVYVTNYGKTKK